MFLKLELENSFFKIFDNVSGLVTPTKSMRVSLSKWFQDNYSNYNPEDPYPIVKIDDVMQTFSTSEKTTILSTLVGNCESKDDVKVLLYGENEANYKPIFFRSGDKPYCALTQFKGYVCNDNGVTIDTI